MGSGDQIIPVLNENVMESISTTSVAVLVLFKAGRQLKSIQNFTCVLHEVNCSKCNKADLKYNNKQQY